MRWVGRNAVVVAVLALLSWPAAAQAHVLTEGRAHAAFLEFVYGVAYSYDIESPPEVRCLRRGGNTHSAYCDYSFSPAKTSTISGPSLCTGSYRLYLVDGRPQVHRAVVRRITCRAVA
jgi:hypothetical protein